MAVDPRVPSIYAFTVKILAGQCTRSVLSTGHANVGNGTHLLSPFLPVCSLCFNATHGYHGLAGWLAGWVIAIRSNGSVREGSIQFIQTPSKIQSSVR